MEISVWNGNISKVTHVTVTRITLTHVTVTHVTHVSVNRKRERG